MVILRRAVKKCFGFQFVKGKEHGKNTKRIPWMLHYHSGQDNCWLNQVKLAYLVGAKLCSCCSKKKLRDKKKAYSRFLRETGKEIKAYSRFVIIQVPWVILPSRSYMKYWKSAIEILEQMWNLVFSSDSVVDFEQVNIYWVVCCKGRNMQSFNQTPCWMKLELEDTHITEIQFDFALPAFF